MEILRTNRLLLSEFSTKDDAFILKLVNTPSWLEFIGDKKVKNLEDAKNYLINGPMASYRENGFGLYLVQLKSNKTPIGMCGLVNRPTLKDVDIGFALLPEYEGKGFGFESALATMEYAQKELNLEKIVAITSKHNGRSQKLLERIGLKFEKLIESDKEGEELMFYSN